MKHVKGTPFHVQLDKEVELITLAKLAHEIRDQLEATRHGNGFYIAAGDGSYFPVPLVFVDDSARRAAGVKDPAPQFINDARKHLEMWARGYINEYHMSLAH